MGACKERKWESGPTGNKYLRVAGSRHTTLQLAREHGLTVYNAVYLELALRRHLPLVTLDAALAEAASRLNVR